MTRRRNADPSLFPGLVEAWALVAVIVSGLTVPASIYLWPEEAFWWLFLALLALEGLF